MWKLKIIFELNILVNRNVQRSQIFGNVLQKQAKNFKIIKQNQKENEYKYENKNLQYFNKLEEEKGKGMITYYNLYITLDFLSFINWK